MVDGTFGAPYSHMHPAHPTGAGERLRVAMAHDPAIQRELAQINAEFAATEADGLDRAP